MYLTTVEATVGADGRAHFEFQGPDTGHDDSKAVLILVEYLGAEEDAEFQVGVTGVGSENLSRVKHAAVFAGRVQETEANVTVSIWARAGSKVRIFAGWASRRIRETVSGLPCRGCRMAVKAALRAALAMVGIPMPGDVLADVLEAYLPKILEVLDGDRVGAFLAELLGEERYHHLVRSMAGVIAGFTKAMKRLDEVCRALCGEIGLC